MRQVSPIKFLLVNAVLTGIAIGLMSVAFYIVLITYDTTGPYCPGKDPAWLGFCSQAPENE